MPFLEFAFLFRQIFILLLAFLAQLYSNTYFFSWWKSVLFMLWGGNFMHRLPTGDAQSLLLSLGEISVWWGSGRCATLPKLLKERFHHDRLGLRHCSGRELRRLLVVNVEHSVNLQFKSAANVKSQIDLQVWAPRFTVVSHSANSECYQSVKLLERGAVVRYLE